MGQAETTMQGSTGGHTTRSPSQATGTPESRSERAPAPAVQGRPQDSRNDLADPGSLAHRHLMMLTPLSPPASPCPGCLPLHPSNPDAFFRAAHNHVLVQMGTHCQLALPTEARNRQWYFRSMHVQHPVYRSTFCNPCMTEFLWNWNYQKELQPDRQQAMASAFINHNIWFDGMEMERLARTTAYYSWVELRGRLGAQQGLVQTVGTTHDQVGYLPESEGRTWSWRGHGDDLESWQAEQEQARREHDQQRQAQFAQRQLSQPAQPSPEQPGPQPRRPTQHQPQPPPQQPEHSPVGTAAQERPGQRPDEPQEAEEDGSQPQQAPRATVGATAPGKRTKEDNIE